MTALSASTTESPAVATLSVARVSPAENATDAGDAPDSIEPVSVTLTATVSASAAAWPSLTSNSAAAPSVTALASAAIVAAGAAARVTVTVYVRVVVPSSAVTVTLISFAPSARLTWSPGAIDTSASAWLAVAVTVVLDAAWGTDAV